MVLPNENVTESGPPPLGGMGGGPRPPAPPIRQGQDKLLPQAHHGLEKVVVEPEPVVERVEQVRLVDGIETVVANVGTDKGGVLLLNETIVVLVPLPAAGVLDVLGGG